MGKRLIEVFVFIVLALLGFSACKKEAPKQLEEIEIEYNDVLVDSTGLKEDEEVKQEQSPLAKYQYSWGLGDEMPELVIIVDDFGNSAGALLEGFADLPPEIVFAVIPDLPHSKKAAETGANKGHEIILHLPMEAENSSISAGERYISKDMDEEEIAALIDSFLSQMPMAIGANNHMGSASTANLATMNSVLKQFKKRKMLFVDSATTAKSTVYPASVEQGMPFIKRDIFLDVPDISDKTLAAKIQELSKYKGRKEPVVIITHCHNKEKLRGLEKFITQVKSMGVKIIPLKEAVNRPVI